LFYPNIQEIDYIAQVIDIYYRLRLRIEDIKSILHLVEG